MVEEYVNNGFNFVYEIGNVYNFMVGVVVFDDVNLV